LCLAEREGSKRTGEDFEETVPKEARMKRLHFKLCSKRHGEHIHTTIFSGEEGHTLANTGTLVQRMGEWQLFGAFLKLGAEYNLSTQTHALVTFEGDEEVAGGVK
jgi:hypothetical protein